MVNRVLNVALKTVPEGGIYIHDQRIQQHERGCNRCNEAFNRKILLLDNSVSYTNWSSLPCSAGCSFLLETTHFILRNQGEKRIIEVPDLSIIKHLTLAHFLPELPNQLQMNHPLILKISVMQK